MSTYTPVSIHPQSRLNGAANAPTLIDVRIGAGFAVAGGLRA